ncbi:MAG: hypothetical protein WC543_05165 [Candidatus Omnitrophota bacterium]
MQFSKNNIVKIVVMLATVCCMLYANLFAVRMMMRYGVETYFYDKLLVAYDIGGFNGLKIELEKIPFSERSHRELKLAKEFTIKLPTLSDPEIFLRDKVQKSKQMINSIINFRSWAIVFMIIIFAWRVSINLLKKSESKKKAE